MEAQKKWEEEFLKKYNEFTKKQQDIFTMEMRDGMDCILQNVKENDGITEYELKLTWTAENAENDDIFDISWKEPMRGILYKWDFRCLLRRTIRSHWNDVMHSMVNNLAPMGCYFDGNDTNSYCWALSESKKYIKIKHAIDDQFCMLDSHFFVGTKQYTGVTETCIVLRVDKRPVSVRRALKDVADWWEQLDNITPLNVPDAAKDPLYSFWYAYHDKVSDTLVEEKCRWAKELGLDICIVDEGWFRDLPDMGNANRSYFTPAPSKFPDMVSHVERVHQIGMKYVLWIAIPFLTRNNTDFPKYKDMLLKNDPKEECVVVDPRYKEVREFLVHTVKNALVEWDLDGFKMDFIDTWAKVECINVPANDRMDIPVLQDAVEACLAKIVEEITAIKPDILLEFRQPYIGPHMKRFANMFRVADCAGNYLDNRVSILDMRMFMGNQAVHSDMLIMPPEEKPETNALQMISSMFGVIQYGGRMEGMPKEMEEMTRFWIRFFKEHKKLLLCSSLEAYEAHLLYTWAKACDENECAVGVYAIDKCVKPDPVDKIYIANGCQGERIFCDLSGTYQVQILDCFGHEVDCYKRQFEGINILQVPVGGLVVMTAL